MGEDGHPAVRKLAERSFARFFSADNADHKKAKQLVARLLLARVIDVSPYVLYSGVSVKDEADAMVSELESAFVGRKAAPYSLSDIIAAVLSGQLNYTRQTSTTI